MLYVFTSFDHYLRGYFSFLAKLHLKIISQFSRLQNTIHLKYPINSTCCTKLGKHVFLHRGITFIPTILQEKYTPLFLISNSFVITYCKQIKKSNYIRLKN